MKEGYLEDRPIQLRNAIETIGMAEDVFVDKSVKTFSVAMAGEKVEVDRTMLRIWKGFAAGVTSEMLSDGQGAIAHDIFTAKQP